MGDQSSPGLMTSPGLTPVAEPSLNVAAAIEYGASMPEMTAWALRGSANPHKRGAGGVRRHHGIKRPSNCFWRRPCENSGD